MFCDQQWNQFEGNVPGFNVNKALELGFYSRCTPKVTTFIRKLKTLNRFSHELVLIALDMTLTYLIEPIREERWLANLRYSKI